MCEGGRIVEDQVFELLEQRKSPDEIVEILDLGELEGIRLIRKVIGERGSPASMAIRESIERMISLPV
jgi:hypothetical protein